MPGEADARPVSVVEVQRRALRDRGRPVFTGLNCACGAAPITAIMGPSGTGKTTLLRLIMGQIDAQSGSRASVFGEEVAQLGRTALYGLRRRVGMLFQNGALLTDLSVFENVAFPVREHARLPERCCASWC